MKIWKIEAHIESEDDLTKKAIMKKIDLNLNCGDGIYLDLDNNFKLTLIKQEDND